MLLLQIYSIHLDAAAEIIVWFLPYLHILLLTAISFSTILCMVEARALCMRGLLLKMTLSSSSMQQRLFYTIMVTLSVFFYILYGASLPLMIVIHQ